MSTPPSWTLVWRYAGESGTIDDVAAEWSESVSLEAAVGNRRSASVSVVLPIDFSEVIPRFHPSRGFASLSYAGRLVIAGSWRDVEYEPPREGRTQVTFKIEQNDQDDRGTYPPLTKYRVQRDPTEIVDYGQPRAATPAERQGFGNEDLVWLTDNNGGNAATDRLVLDPVLRSEKWPNIAEPAEGASFAWPIGRPGRGTLLAAVPAYMIDETGGSAKILIAGRAIDAGTVSIFGPSSPGGNDIVRDDGIDVFTDEDPDGFRYSYVLAADLVNVDPSAQNSFYWSSPDIDTGPSGAGDVLVDVLSASTLPIAVREFANLASRLNVYKLDGYVDRPVSPMQLVRDQILPMLPVSIVPTAAGLAPVLWPFLDDREARGPHLIDGYGVALEGPVRFLDNGGASSTTVRFAYRADRQTCAKTARADAASTVNARYAAIGGYQETEVPLVWDPGTAALMASDAVRYSGWSPRVVALRVLDWDRWGPGGEYPLTAGFRVAFSCPRLGLDRVAAVVGSVEYGARRALVRLWLLDDPMTA